MYLDMLPFSCHQGPHYNVEWDSGAVDHPKLLDDLQTINLQSI